MRKHSAQKEACVQPTKRKLIIARLLVAAVFASNLYCALAFVFDPASYVGAYQVEGASAHAMVQSIGIAFLMWNATYPLVIWRPDRYRALFGVVIAQQVIGLVGESALLSTLGPELATLGTSIVRFIAFDAAGLVLLILAFILSRK